MILEYNTPMSNAIFVIVNDEIVFNHRVGVYGEFLGLAGYTYGYDTDPNNGRLVADATGANYFVGKFFIHFSNNA